MGFRVAELTFSFLQLTLTMTVSVLGQEEGYMVKYTPPPEGVPEGEARENSLGAVHKLCQSVSQWLSQEVEVA